MPQLDRLSKSRFMSGRQCPLKLWNYYFRPDLGEDPDAGTQARFDEGDDVGELARQRYPGVLVTEDREHLEQALVTTARLIKDPSVLTLHEGAFEFEGTLVRPDVLIRKESGTWDLIEVKSCLEVDDVHCMDAAYQRWVLGKMGMVIDQTYVMVPNRDYRYQGGAYDLENYFRMVDVTAYSERNVAFIESEVARFLDMLRQPAPPLVTPGSQCSKPYECPYQANCASQWPKSPLPIEWLNGYGFVRSAGCHAEGIHGMLDIPFERLNEMQRIHRTCHETGQPWVNPKLADALKAFEFPIHFLDFEALASAVPKLIGSGPHEAVPFQWSCHTLHEDGRLIHHEFLANDYNDPRAPLFEALFKVLGEKGSICSYSHYEKTTLNHAAKAIPALAGQLQALVRRLVDLLPIVNKNIYLPAFYGSFSIKSVLPALVPSFGYDHLQVQDGLAAGDTFVQMIGGQDPILRQSLRNDLLAYCGQDSLAMVKVREALIHLA